jgi:hypothetical protein
MSTVSIMPRRASAFVERLGERLAEWRRFSREVTAQAELERKLRGVDERLLRDMGLEWTGRRLQRAARDENGWL